MLSSVRSVALLWSSNDIAWGRTCRESLSPGAQISLVTRPVGQWSRWSLITRDGVGKSRRTVNRLTYYPAFCFFFKTEYIIIQHILIALNKTCKKIIWK